MERFFQILAVILIGVAAYFLWIGNADGVFLAGVFGAVAFFMSIRFQVKGRLERREAERLAAEEEESTEESAEDSQAVLPNESSSDAAVNPNEVTDEAVTNTERKTTGGIL
jgi:hypothetical protein